MGAVLFYLGRSRTTHRNLGKGDRSDQTFGHGIFPGGRKRPLGRVRLAVSITKPHFFSPFLGEEPLKFCLSWSKVQTRERLTVSNPFSPSPEPHTHKQYLFIVVLNTDIFKPKGNRTDHRKRDRSSHPRHVRTEGSVKTSPHTYTLP